MAYWLFFCGLCQGLLFLSLEIPSLALAPPQFPPNDLIEAYSLNGSIPIDHFYIDDSRQGQGTHYKYPETSIERFISGAHTMISRFQSMRDHLAGGEVEVIQRLPRQQWFQYAMYMYQSAIQGKKVCVFGAMEPWAEAFALALGAKEVVTIEYNVLTFDHPSLLTLSQANFSLLYDEHSPYRHYFDVALSASAFDHDGLGRYGDPLNPNGDIEAMQKALTLLQPKGIMIFTVPIGPDVVVFNMLRRYGEKRLPLLLEGWNVVEKMGWQDELINQPRPWTKTYEPVLILSPKSEALSNDNAVHDGRDL